jgi:hypothetical protein
MCSRSKNIKTSAKIQSESRSGFLPADNRSIYAYAI